MPGWILECTAGLRCAAERRRDDSRSPRDARPGLGSSWRARRPGGGVLRRLVAPLGPKMYVLGHECMQDWYSGSFAMELHRQHVNKYFRILT